MVEIKEVTSIGELKKFIRFPDHLYKGNTCRVPPLHFVEEGALNRKVNPAFDYCDAKYWIAFRNGEIVGRIAAILNTSSNKIRNEKSMRFGWMDFIDDMDISYSLFKKVEDWARQNGLNHVHGPLGFTDMDLEGMLIEGFDEVGTQAVLYNYPYYPIHLEQLGYRKEVDWLQFEIKIPNPVPERVTRLSKHVREKYNLRVLDAKKKKDLIPYVKKMFRTLNEAYKNLYGFVPLTEKQMEYYTKQYFSIINPRHVCFVLDPNDDVVAFGISIYSISRALIKAKGSVFPFGWFYIYNALRKNDTVDLFLEGVKPKYHNKGLPAIFFEHMMKAYHEDGVKTAISSSTLEHNTPAYLMFLDFEHRQHMKRRCYGKYIDSLVTPDGSQ